MRAIAEAPAPQDVSQLRSFLGMVNYYSKFLPNLSSTLSPLYRLLGARDLELNDPVFARNYAPQGHRWLAGKVLEKTGPLFFRIELQNGNIVRRHIDQLRGRTSTAPAPADNPFEDALPNPEVPNLAGGPPPPTPPIAPRPQALRRSARAHRPPDRLILV